MENKKIDKLMETIGLIISSHGGIIHSKTKLVKLIYLIDLISKKKNNYKITEATYKSYFYGPYSEDIDIALHQLKDLELIDVYEDFSLYTGRQYYTIKLKDLPNFGALSEEEKKLIRNITSRYKNKPLDEILEEVYNTEEFSRTNFGEEISF